MARKEIPEEPLTRIEQYLNAIVENGGGGGQVNPARVVDELPEEGEPGYIYLVLKSHSAQGNVYDEFIWALQPDGVTYGWELLGSSDTISLLLYNETGQHTDGAMTQKATTDAINSVAEEIPDTLTDQDYEALWEEES